VPKKGGRKKPWSDDEKRKEQLKKENVHDVRKGKRREKKRLWKSQGGGRPAIAGKKERLNPRKKG